LVTTERQSAPGVQVERDKGAEELRADELKAGAGEAGVIWAGALESELPLIAMAVVDAQAEEGLALMHEHTAAAEA